MYKLFRFCDRIAEFWSNYISTGGGWSPSPLGLQPPWASAGVPGSTSRVIVLIIEVKIRFFHLLYIINIQDTKAELHLSGSTIELIGILCTTIIIINCENNDCIKQILLVH